MLVASLEEIEFAAKKSNMRAIAVYGDDFNRFISDKDGLTELDMFVENSAYGEYPVLKNGSNFYWERSRIPLRLNHKAYQSPLPKVDRFVVVRESTGFLSHKPKYCEGSVALNSIIADMEPAYVDQTMRIPRLGGEIECKFRFFDSHPSCSFYLNTAIEIIDDFGLETSFPEIKLREAPYCPDLATKFSKLIAPTLFFSSPFLVQDLAANPSRNSGRYREFVNASAPIQKHIIIIGDSHSFSGLSPAFSFFFKRVSYYWASRASRYGGLKDEIMKAVSEADFSIEEISERFFIRNFGTMPPGHTDPERL
tara:strand:- start:24708 stop:25634 length:927 start_codon:yes stop_codon:yes gene_type:complete